MVTMLLSLAVRNDVHSSVKENLMRDNRGQSNKAKGAVLGA